MPGTFAAEIITNHGGFCECERDKENTINDQKEDWECYICGCDLSHWGFEIGRDYNPADLTCDSGDCMEQKFRLDLGERFPNKYIEQNVTGVHIDEIVNGDWR